MELLETQNPERRRLIETSDRHKRELEKEVKSLSDKTEKTLKNALIIGGVLAVTYLVVNQLSSSTKKKKRAKAKAAVTNGVEDDLIEEEGAPSVFSQMGAKIADTATVVLLDLAKDALAEFLKTRKQKDGNS
jgi:translation initiation factor 2B subunit (eIF-2B alpha/beta/delta family)